jgi:phosphoglycerol transferase MdoB-like AlkP superfamily enzyme
MRLANSVRRSAAIGVVFLLAGLLVLYLLRHLLFQVIFVLLGIVGLLIGFVLIVVGLGLIFGTFWMRGRMRRFLAVGGSCSSHWMPSSIALNS